MSEMLLGNAKLHTISLGFIKPTFRYVGSVGCVRHCDGGGCGSYGDVAASIHVTKTQHGVLTIFGMCGVCRSEQMRAQHKEQFLGEE